MQSERTVANLFIECLEEEGVRYVFGVPGEETEDLLFALAESSIGEYNASTGTPIDANFITGLSGLTGLAVSGNSLYVVETSTVGEYDATTGAAINPNFITGLSYPSGGIALSGNDLFVSTVGTNSLGQLGMPNNLGTIGKYNATTGAPINANFITGLDIPTGLAVLGNNLFSADYLRGTISEYSAVTGATLDSRFVTEGLSGPEQIATSGNTLFVANQSVSPNSTRPQEQRLARDRTAVCTSTGALLEMNEAPEIIRRAK